MPKVQESNDEMISRGRAAARVWGALTAGMFLGAVLTLLVIGPYLPAAPSVAEPAQPVLVRMGNLAITEPGTRIVISTVKDEPALTVDSIDELKNTAFLWKSTAEAWCNQWNSIYALVKKPEDTFLNCDFTYVEPDAAGPVLEFNVDVVTVPSSPYVPVLPDELFESGTLKPDVPDPNELPCRECMMWPGNWCRPC